MNEKPRPAAGSLIERAAEAYDFAGLMRGKGEPRPVEQASSLQRGPEPQKESASTLEPEFHPGHGLRGDDEFVPIDRQHLRDAGLIVPGAPPSALSEEFRLVKRQLLLAALGNEPVERGQLILVCSAHPNEGKTFSAVNLALSMASETDIEVLLVDADVAKPEVLSTLGIPGEAGLMDALADPSIDVESLVIGTDVPNLNVLPAGLRSNNDTELLASARTQALIERLVDGRPNRIVLFDSAPALAASPASVLALHVGQVLLVVRADRTSEADLRDTLALLGSGPEIRLMLNAVSYRGSNRRYGSYYGFGDWS